MKLKRVLTIIVCLFVTLLCSGFQEEDRKQTLHFKVLYGLPLVDLNIQGYVIPLILDLGSHTASLNKDIIEKTKIAKTAKMVNSLDVYNKTFTSPTYISSKSLIDKYLLTDLEFVEMEGYNAEFESGTPEILTYGKIGREPFLDKVLFFDRKKEICIIDQAYAGKKTDPTKYHAGDWMETDLKLNQGIGISLCLLIDSSERKEFILDTGSNISLINTGSVLKVPINLRNESIIVPLKLNNNTLLGLFSFYPFDLTNMKFDGILGFDFFDHYLICLDFPNKKLFLKKY